MQNARLRTVLWFPGPALAMFFASTAAAANVGPGFFALALFAALVFLIVVPAVQIALLATRGFKGRYLAVCALALSVGVLVVWVPTAFGVFDFY